MTKMKRYYFTWYPYGIPNKQRFYVNADTISEAKKSYERGYFVFDSYVNEKPVSIYPEWEDKDEEGSTC